MKQVNIAQAKAQLSNLVDAVLRGEEVIIARRGVAVVRLTSLASAKVRPQFGRLAGKVKVHDDFDAPLTDFDAYR